MPKPKPFVIKGKPPSAKQMLRDLERGAAQFEDTKTVMRLFKGLRKDRLDQLAWLAATKRGRRLIGKALRKLHKKNMLELRATVADICKPRARPKAKVIRKVKR